MNTVLIGNIVSFIGCILMVGVGLVKKKEHVIRVQCVQFVIQGAANFILGGVTGFIANLISIARNLWFARREGTVKVKLFFIGLQAVLSLFFLDAEAGIIGWFPLFSAVVFTWFLDIKSDAAFKVVILAAQVFWVVYDFYYSNYVSCTFDIFTMISTTIGLCWIIKDARTKAE